MKALVTKSKLDSLADVVAEKTASETPLTIDQMITLLNNSFYILTKGKIDTTFYYYYTDQCIENDHTNYILKTAGNDIYNAALYYASQIEDTDGIKVSLRCSRFLSYDGIHFGNIIREVSGEVGGTGGGHAMACGAYIPLDRKEEFIQKFNILLNENISI